MNRIYSYANDVVMWLEMEENDRNYEIKLLRDWGSSVEVDWSTFVIHTPKGGTTERMKFWISCKYSSREYKAVCALLQRSWFKQVWVRQESSLAWDQTSQAVCGRVSLCLANIGKRFIACRSWSWTAIHLTLPGRTNA